MNRHAEPIAGPRPKRPAWVLVAALAISLAGCGGGGRPVIGPTYAVKGRVTLPDGKPLPGVEVVFSGPVTGHLTTGRDGAFASQGDQDGLPAGDYKVRLEVAESRGALRRPVLPFPGKYLDEDTTDLRAAVRPEGPNDFPFRLNRRENAAVGLAGAPRSGR